MNKAGLSSVSKFTLLIILAASTVGCGLMTSCPRVVNGNIDRHIRDSEDLKLYFRLGRDLGPASINYGEIYWGDSQGSVIDIIDRMRSDKLAHDRIVSLIEDPIFLKSERDGSLVLFLAANVLEDEHLDLSLFMASGFPVHRFTSYFVIKSRGMQSQFIGHIVKRIGALLLEKQGERELLFLLSVLADEEVYFPLAQAVAIFEKDRLLHYFRENSWETVLDPHRFYDGAGH